MNAQRWLALGLLALIVLCIASSNVWLAPLRERGEEAATPTPTAQAAEAEEVEPTAVIEGLMIESEATLNPAVVELLEDIQVDSMGVGDEPFVIMAGDFTVIDAMHRGEGTASIYRIGEKRHVLRLDPFSVTSGPDLHVILSTHEAPRTSADVLLPTYVDLGPLKNTTSAQNFEIAETIDLEQFKSVVIYSMSFNIAYTTATLRQVRGEG
jgi:hypothetical protein